MGTFEVDLQGLLRVFGGHLYSSPSVFVRELVQNGVDAVTMAGGDGRVVVWADGRQVHFEDDGIGLDEEGLVRHLARIGASSKRSSDPAGSRSPDLIGQFGIGLLSAFLVADRIVVDTRTAAGAPIRWTATADGETRLEPGGREGRGTRVTVEVRPDSARWTDPERLRHALLDHVPHVRVPVWLEQERISRPAPWLSDDDGEVVRWIEATHEAPLAIRRVSVGGRGGVLWIRRGAAGLGGGLVDLYCSGVRIQTGTIDALPSWAGLCGGVLDLPELSPTASREGFVRDAAWDDVTAALRAELCDWLRGLAGSERMAELFELHHLHLMAACLDDPSLMNALADEMPFVTNAGTLPLGDIARLGKGLVRVATSQTDFAQISTVAEARGELIVDGSHVHERPFLQAWARGQAGRRVEELDIRSLGQWIEPAPEHEARFRAVLQEAARLLADAEVAPTLGRFAPAEVPALLMADATRLRQRVRALSESGNPLQRALLAGLSVARKKDSVPLVLNVDNPLVSALPGLADPERAARTVRILYAQAAIGARHTLSPAESRWLSDDLLEVVRTAVSTGPVH